MDSSEAALSDLLKSTHTHIHTYIHMPCKVEKAQWISRLFSFSKFHGRRSTRLMVAIHRYSENHCESNTNLIYLGVSRINMQQCVRKARRKTQVGSVCRPAPGLTRAPGDSQCRHGAHTAASLSSELLCGGLITATVLSSSAGSPSSTVQQTADLFDISSPCPERFPLDQARPSHTQRPCSSQRPIGWEELWEPGPVWKDYLPMEWNLLWISEFVTEWTELWWVKIHL